MATDRPAPALVDVERLKREAESRRKAEEAETLRQRSETAANARRIWEASTEPKDHPYLKGKGLEPGPTLRQTTAEKVAESLGYRLRAKGAELEGQLLVGLIRQGDRLSSAEFIDGQGRKAALAGRGSKAGGFWATAKLPDHPDVILVGEGMATTLAASTASGNLGVAALSSGNLQSVARWLRSRYPSARLVILADLHRETGEPDQHAVESAQEVGLLALPTFVSRGSDEKDFADLFAKEGADAVRDCISAAASVVAPGSTQSGGCVAPYGGAPSDWPEPIPLVPEESPIPYPVGRFPLVLREALTEVVAYVQCPPGIAAASALGVLSMAAQGLVNVRRDPGLEGPVSLYLLAVAESGERKSTVDGLFAKPIHDWEKERFEATKAERAEASAALEEWKAKRDGLVASIRNRSHKPDKARDVDVDGLALRELEANKPEPARIPRLIHNDATSEALSYGLATGWPSGGLLSSEAGVVFGSHSMGREHQMKCLSLFNVLWDGASHNVDRRTSESFRLQNVRFSISLAIQPETLRQFFDASRGLPRGSGFLARFLIAAPHSTQGTRRYKSAPDSWPALSRFHRRIAELLERLLRFAEGGGVEVETLTLSLKAREIWVQFHDRTEHELRPDGEFEALRDVASKAADNAARMAALFHVLEHGPSGEVGTDHMEAATVIVGWHLLEARRFLGELATPPTLADAMQLWRWIRGRCAMELPVRDVLRFGPNRLRNRKTVEAAIVELESAGYVRRQSIGAKRLLVINPGLKEQINGL